VNSLKDAGRRLTGFKRREFQAKIALDYFGESARKAERGMGWGRESVEKGLKERESGIRCVDNYQQRGKKRTEDKIPSLREDMISLAERETQADPAMKSSLTYTRITGKAMRKALIDEKGYDDDELPTGNTIGNILNRMGYNLKRVLKAKPLKKPKQVDEIFENVWEVNRQSDENPESLRISIDAKAKLSIGESSRNGKSRDMAPKKAGDHDMNPECKLVPYGILNVLSGLLTIFFGTSFETSDFIVDCLEMWWNENKEACISIKELVINLDNGPNSASGRTQFIRRMIEFADETGLRIRLAYYPPYHSKYNSVERCWGRLGEHWNGEILDSVDRAVNWACTMTWKGIEPVIHLWEKIYEKGISLTKKEMKYYESRIERSNSLPKWDVTIQTSSA
jgi:DDE family transposase